MSVKGWTPTDKALREAVDEYFQNKPSAKYTPNFRDELRTYYYRWKHGKLGVHSMITLLEDYAGKTVKITVE